MQLNRDPLGKGGFKVEAMAGGRWFAHVSRSHPHTGYGHWFPLDGSGRPLCGPQRLVQCLTQSFESRQAALDAVRECEASGEDLRVVCDGTRGEDAA